MFKVRKKIPIDFFFLPLLLAEEGKHIFNLLQILLKYRTVFSPISNIMQNTNKIFNKNRQKVENISSKNRKKIRMPTLATFISHSIGSSGHRI